jgi:tRNA uridine 5-carboxymethylaminomethyl modification enzyme
MKNTRFECIVIGAGHAGAEAAHAAARMGIRTALITISKSTIAQMSCNPAIGGLAKGQIVREIDALGGLMGRAIDATGIQFRILNRSKGPAVQSPRAQADKYQYAAWIAQALERTEGLTVIEAMVNDVRIQDDRVTGVVCENGAVYEAEAVVITTGTFLNGRMHIGTDQFTGGRLNEPASTALSDCLKRLGLTVGRLKTGTPPRLDGSTIDYSKLEIQQGDETPVPFSYLTNCIQRTQIPCWVTYTNERIHQLLRENLNRSPMYSGQITSVGPRYCPSIEAKIVRFADKNRHQVFLEPEDGKVSTIYCNGISTSFPKDVQQRMLALLPGAEQARIVHYAYAIEYDYCPAMQLKSNLETKRIQGLFLAGQINGTSGYEEAGGQGLLAGVNVALKIKELEPLILKRSEAYLGVLIDDLLTREIHEPYRMFTSRAEYRLTLRSDNADRRLTPIGREVGLVSDDRWDTFQTKCGDLGKLKTYLQTTRAQGSSLWDRLRRPQNDFVNHLDEDPFVRNNRLSHTVQQAAAIDAKYEGYLAKQDRLVANLSTLEWKKMPKNIDYQHVNHLRAEAKEKLSLFQPETLGQASRIGGITPADITVLQVYLKKHNSGK